MVWRALGSQCSKLKSGHLSGRGRRKSSTMFSTVPDYTSTKNCTKSSGPKDKDQKMCNTSKVTQICHTNTSIYSQYKKRRKLLKDILWGKIIDCKNDCISVALSFNKELYSEFLSLNGLRAPILG